MTFQEINDLKDYLFEEFSFTKFSKSIPINKYQMMVSLPSDTYLENLPNSVFHHIRTEFNQKVSKKITTSLINDCENFDYYDTIKSGSIDLLSFPEISKLFDYIIYCNNNEFTNILTNSNIASILQNSSFFSMCTNNYKSNQIAGRILNIGKLHNINVWVDPYMSYNDNKVIMFNNIDINIQNVNIKIDKQSQSSINSSLLLSFYLGLNVGRSKVLFIIDNESSPEFQKFKSFQRDKKINNILGEKE
jgi:hypothetical protein